SVGVHRCVLMCGGEDNIVQRENSYKLAVFSHRQPPDLSAAHRGHSCIHVVVWRAGMYRAGCYLFDCRVRRPTVPSANRDADVSVGHNACQFPVLHHGQDAAVIRPHQFDRFGEVRIWLAAFGIACHDFSDFHRLSSWDPRLVCELDPTACLCNRSAEVWADFRRSLLAAYYEFGAATTWTGPFGTVWAN